MQTVLSIPFFADAAMPIWMMGAGWRIDGGVSNPQYLVSGWRMPVILFMRRKRNKKP